MPDPLRVLLISHDLSLSGAPLLCAEVAALWRREGWRVSLAAYEGIDEHPHFGAFFARHGIERLELPDPSDRRAIDEGYDVIVVNTSLPRPWFEELIAPGDALARRLAARTIFWLHEAGAPYVSPEARAKVLRAGQAVFDSHVCREAWTPHDRPLDSAWEVIHPGLTDDFLSAAVDARAQESSLEPRVRAGAPRRRTRTRLGIPRDAFVVLVVGVLPHKGSRLVTRAFGRWLERLGEDEPSPPHLVLVGAHDVGEAATIRSDLEAWPERRRELVHFEPPTAEVGDHYAAADLLVVHSLPPGEAFGRVSIEAMAYGLPVLGTDLGGTVEIVLHRVTGWLHGTEDLATVVDQMDYLRSHPELARSFGEAGLRRVRRSFTERRQAREWLEVLERVRKRPVVEIGKWERTGKGSPAPHIEAHACRVGRRLLLFGGFGQTYWDVNTGPPVWLDLDNLDWSPGPPFPDGTDAEIARSHGGICHDDSGNVYLVAGQRGPRYARALRSCWMLSATTDTWSRLPDLPVPRYCGALAYWRGQLHLFPGDLEDRKTPCREHWILESGGSGGWRRHRDRPVASDHFGSVTLRGPLGLSLYLVGGEHGHAATAAEEDEDAAPGAYIAHPYAHRYDFESDRWSRLADLPIAVHHVGHQIVAIDERHLLLLGGAGHGSATTAAIQLYDIETDRWRVLDVALPRPLIGAVTWFDDGHVYVLGGQTALSDDDPRPGEVLAEMVRTPVRVVPAGRALPQRTAPRPMSSFASTSGR